MSANAEKAMAEFADFARMFPEKLFVSIKTYADESGTHDPFGIAQGSEIAGIAGYVAWCHDWEQFCGEWRTMLDRYEVPRFHFSEFADHKNRAEDKAWPYYKWGKPKREKFLIDLAGIANKWTKDGSCIGGFVRVQDYARIIPRWYQEIGSPYGLCFLLFYETLVAQIERQWPVGGARVSIMFDHNFKDTRWSLWSSLHYHLAKTRRDPHDRLGSITFGDSKDILPLQAADMIVYLSRQQLWNRVRGRPVSQNSFVKSLGRNSENTNIRLSSPVYLEQLAAKVESLKEDLLATYNGEEEEND